ncbi:precorrin-2 dehydrogenase/sirohydrochlorin ferrochelatase family protein [Pseudobutyrivibrio xylanivorans]|uniref:precorrin-2 dehydrogenase n=1 Tax=Pseudobutyrivibrio xylanivorans DSM 14809 TaxID=1123012 RepID=A0A1M6DX67_PSEXY|nr:bifunctional precorrin-2 dehydrogenase/sirohydrochlorin ferrochelatase [Pseudobutyrivibrio xylanivorans]SHI77854.1 precorrin-2 dehydrogenase / sirohydrochlorin ferrochelatase [Pseudobutyrivibrio xylanivorans DSM 14809]
MAFFPMFIDITGAKCLVIGSTDAVLRRSDALLDFGAKVMVKTKDEFTPGDIQGCKMVLVDTDDEEINLQISMMCKDAGIPVNIVGHPNLGTFSFPAYLREGNLVGAFSSSGHSTALAKFLVNKEKEVLTPKLGELNEMLGKWKQPIEELFPQKSAQNSAFEQLIDYALCYDGIPTDEEVEELLGAISMTL